MPPARKSAFKAKSRAKPKTFQPIRANFQPSRVCVLNRLGSANNDLQKFLSNKQKSRSEEQVHILPSQCGQAGCQFVSVYSANCCLGLIFTISSPNQPSVFDRLSAQTSERPKSRMRRKAKKPHLVVASVNMTGRGRDSMRSRRGNRGFALAPLVR